MEKCKIEYRRAAQDDIPEINSILHQEFVISNDVVDNANYDNVYLAISDNYIIGVCVLSTPVENNFEEWAIRFVAVRTSFRKCGIAATLIAFAIADIPDEICAEGWRTWDNPDKAHAHTPLVENGFELVEKGYIHWSGAIFCKYVHCKYVNNEQAPTCHCWEDIYVRKAKQV